ncbi:MAG: amino acid ABC transporter ATP-binding protein [Acidimicrobiales bacterium]
MPPVLELIDIHKTFGDNPVLRGVDLSVHRGDIVGLIGPSGSGKSTLLRCINQLETIDSGDVRFLGSSICFKQHRKKLVRLEEKDVCRARQQISMVFQSFNLFPNLTVLENVMLGPTKVLRENADEAQRNAAELIARVGLAHKMAAFPGKLSGGQQQRVAIARALAMRPEVILFDEPTSALDPELVNEVLAVIRDLADDGITMVLVSHELRLIRAIAGQVLFMSEGLVIERGSPDKLFSEPCEERTRQFIREIGA